MIYSYDCEVFSHDWVFVFKEYDKEDYVIIHNNNSQLAKFLSDSDLYFSFNGSHYDKWIVRAILQDASNAAIKDLSDFIIAQERNPWEHWLFDTPSKTLNDIDLRKDMQAGLSLKAIEGHFGLPIIESSVDFNVNRPLTEVELKETIHYCKSDVRATERILSTRIGYFQTKQDVAVAGGIDPVWGLAATNAKLVAEYLRAKPVSYDDERIYEMPQAIDLTRIPTQVLDFFSRMGDYSIPDEELFSSDTTVYIDKIPVVYGFGGVHGARDNYINSCSKSRQLILFDVSSLYPSLMILFNMLSRAVRNPESYKDAYDKRMEAKRTGDTKVNQSMKLVLNTTYGCSNNPYNKLYDPRTARSVCVTGQLLLTDLAVGLLTVPSLELVQLNTDGVLLEVDTNQLNAVYSLIDEWENRTGLKLSEDRIKSLIQKDVNNYIMVDDKDNVIVKGGYLVRGVSTFGSWNINNNMKVVSQAILDYFLKERTAWETVSSNDNTLDYQIITKSSGKYESPFWINGFDQVPVQKVNRVYASRHPMHGTLYHTNKSTGKVEKQSGGIPGSVYIDNYNETDISQIDKEWYIRLANKRISDFIGKSNQITMEDYICQTKVS